MTAATRSRPVKLIAAEAPIALFLDLDGTVIDIARTPAAVTVPDGLVDTLGKLSAALGGALGVVTGRPLRQADVLLSPLRLVGVGVHGTQVRRAAGADCEELAPPAPPALIGQLKVVFAGIPGVLIEEKGPVVAVHYRACPEARPQIVAALREMVQRRQHSMVLSHGRMVVELVPEGFSKHSGVMALAALPAFSGRRPVMIGDDIADEDGFAAAVKLGGMGLRVAGEHFPQAEADFAGPQAVREWLAELAVGIAGTRTQARA